MIQTNFTECCWCHVPFENSVGVTELAADDGRRFLLHSHCRMDFYRGLARSGLTIELEPVGEYAYQEPA